MSLGRQGGAWLLVRAAAAVAIVLPATGCAHDAAEVLIATDGGIDLATAPASAPLPVCSIGHWCWEKPLPQGNRLRAVWGSGSNDVWAVGDQGAIVHWDGHAWGGGRGPSGVTSPLLGLWGSGPTDLWACGYGGVLLHGDGALWAPVDSGTTGDLRRIWGSGPRDVWIAGDRVLHFDGDRWSPVAEIVGGAVAVWGSAADDVWMIGNPNSRIWHFDGVHWTPSEVVLPGDASFTFTTLGGSGRRDVWLGGRDGWSHIALVHYDGVRATRIPIEGGPFGSIGAIHSSGGADGWAWASWHLLRFDGTKWSEWSRPSQPSVDFFANDAWGSSPSELFAVGDGVLHWDGKAWTSQQGNLTGRDASAIVGLVGRDPRDVWAGTANGAILHYDGTAWQLGDGPKLTRGTALLRLWGDPGTVGLWALYDGEVHRLGGPGGGGWNRVDDGGASGLRAVWGSAHDDVWVVGKAGTALHWDGRNLLRVFTNTNEDLFDLSGRAIDSLAVIGAHGTLLSGDGRRFLPEVPPNATTSLQAIISDGSGWLLSTDDGLFHTDGWRTSAMLSTKWTRQAVAAPDGRPFWRFSDSGSDLWGTSGYGSVFDRNAGDRWILQATGCAYCGESILALPTDVWIGGRFGEILHLRR